MKSFEGSCVAGIAIRSWRWRSGRPAILRQPDIVYLVVTTDIDLAVSANEEPALAGVDTELGEVVDFDFLDSL